MFILLIFLPLVILTVWARRAVIRSWRESFVLALIACGFWVFVSTEALSYFHLICFSGIAGMWVSLGIMASIALGCEQKPLPAIKVSGASLSWAERMIVGFLAVILIATMVNALNSPPNTWDALTYHMSRVAHWVQDRSVEFYPTHILRQLFSNPWQEYAILQFQVLGRNDHWASMVQWFCMAASLVNVSLIARAMGLSRCSQWLAVLVAATVPMGIIESTSVQGDYAATLWLSSSLVAFLNLLESRRMGWALACGVSLGLACLSKGTAMVLSFPIVCWILGDVFRPYAGRKFIQAVLILSIMVSINGLFIERNRGLFHQKMLGPVTQPGESLINDSINYQTFTANLLRNAGVHLGTASDKFNGFLEKRIAGLAAAIRVDLNDPRASFAGSKFHIGKPSRNEDTAGAPLHLALFLFVVILLFFRRSINVKVVPYLFCILAMVFMFLLVVRWQPWITRFQLPLFILFSPLCAAAVDGYVDKKNNMIMVVALFIIALPYAFDASPRHLFGPKSLFHKDRMERYFLGNSAWAAPYAQGAGEILKDGCQNVGLILGEDSWEYPLWALLEHDHPWNGRLEHVGVENVSKGVPYPLGSFDPCRIVVIGNDGKEAFRLGSVNYRVTNVFGSGREMVRIFSKV